MDTAGVDQVCRRDFVTGPKQDVRPTVFVRQIFDAQVLVGRASGIVYRKSCERTEILRDGFRGLGARTSGSGVCEWGSHLKST